MPASAGLTKIFSAAVLCLVFAIGNTVVAPKPAHACGPAAATDLFCLDGGVLPPGFGDTFRSNLIDPLGGQCTSGGTGCPGDTFVDVNVGECPDGSTGCNAGGDILLPVNNDPCISCFVPPGEVGSLTGDTEAAGKKLTEYLAQKRNTLEFQQASLKRATETARETSKARRENETAIQESEKRIGFLEKDLGYPDIRDNKQAWNRTFKALEAEKKKLRGLKNDAYDLKRLENTAAESESLQAEMIQGTKDDIARANLAGKVPDNAGGALTQFGGGAEATQTEYRYRGGKNSTYNRLVRGGKGVTFETDTGSYRTVDTRLFQGIGSQFLRSTSGHAANNLQENLSAGTTDGYQIAAALFGYEPHQLTHKYMLEGLHRKLRDAVKNGEVPGTIEIVPTDESGFGTKEIVRIPPEGLPAAKKYLDVQDSLFEGVQEDNRNTESEQDRRDAEDDEDRNRDFHRMLLERRLQREKKNQKAPPVPAKDITDDIGNGGFDSVIDEIQGIVVIA